MIRASTLTTDDVARLVEAVNKSMNLAAWG